MSVARVFHWDEVLVLMKLFAIGDAFTARCLYIFFNYTRTYIMIDKILAVAVVISFIFIYLTIQGVTL